jgi:hypothetical protein
MFLADPSVGSIVASASGSCSVMSNMTKKEGNQIVGGKN